MDELEKKLLNSIHSHLAHSYLSWFAFLLLGILLDIFLPLRLFGGAIWSLVGAIFIIFASGIIFWAQRTTRNLHKGGDYTTSDFYRGPYAYTRTPTHSGLFLLTTGFGLIMNAFFVVATSVAAYVIGKRIFLRNYEKLLVEKYGDSYRAYMEEVKI